MAFPRQIFKIVIKIPDIRTLTPLILIKLIQKSDFLLIYRLDHKFSLKISSRFIKICLIACKNQGASV